MSDTEYEMRFELIRNNVVVHSVEPRIQSGDDDVEISMNSSKDSFPTLSFKSLNKELNNIFIQYSKSDVIRFSMTSGSTNKHSIMFEGEFFSQNIKYERKTDCLVLTTESIHSFFRLSLLEFSSKHDFRNVTFSETIKTLIGISGINVDIFIDKDIAELPITGISSHTNLFRFFKEICLMVNAVVTFNSDNTVNISSRVSRTKQIESQEVININKEDIISYESKNQI